MTPAQVAAQITARYVPCTSPTCDASRYQPHHAHLRPEHGGDPGWLEAGRGSERVGSADRDRDTIDVVIEVDTTPVADRFEQIAKALDHVSASVAEGYDRWAEANRVGQVSLRESIAERIRATTPPGWPVPPIDVTEGHD